MEELGTGAGQAKLTFQIGSTQYRTFNFFEEDETTPVDASTWTFEFFIKKFKGDIDKIIDLTLGNGISFVTYSDTGVLITVTGAQASIEEGEYYWELRRTDLNIPLLSGVAIFQFNA